MYRLLAPKAESRPVSSSIIRVEDPLQNCPDEPLIPVHGIHQVPLDAALLTDNEQVRRTRPNAKTPMDRCSVSVIMNPDDPSLWANTG